MDSEDAALYRADGMLDRRLWAAARAQSFGPEWLTMAQVLKQVPMSSHSFTAAISRNLRCRPNSNRAKSPRGCGILVHRDDVAALVRVKNLLRVPWVTAARLVGARDKLVEALRR